MYIFTIFSYNKLTHMFLNYLSNLQRCEKGVRKRCVYTLAQYHSLKTGFNNSLLEFYRNDDKIISFIIFT